MSDAGEEQTVRRSSPPVIVGIGASAGGISVLQDFFDALPGDTGAAFVIIVHLSPTERSDLTHLLARHTKMSVLEVGPPTRLQGDHIYVIPPDRKLQIADGEIVAAEFNEPRGQRAPIDSFFRSLAEEHGDGFAIILSGAGSDGTLGIRAVKETGGIILVQDPNEAEYSSMPRSAISTGIADFVLPAAELARRLAELIEHKSSEPNALPKLQDDVLRRILAYVRVRTGHDFSKYKRATVMRRIARRLQITRIENPSEYYDYLRDTPEEAQALLGDLLISVTTFFRDNDAFEVLRRDVLPQIFHAKQASDAVRVWVPGCATGEEAYSVSILLLEEGTRQQKRLPIQVFGSDLDTRALAIGREGRYPAAIEADVSEERLRRYFQREGDQYHVRQELRDTVLFASHSLLKDPPFSKIDLISCRNLLIYLDRELQQQVCSTFHYALNPEGFLFLGSSETADNPPGLFRTVDRKARIYQTTVRSGEKPRLLPRLLGAMNVLREQPVHPTRATAPSLMLTEAATHRQAIEKLAPPSILVDSTHRVIHLSENAGRFLQPAGGPLSGDVVDLVRPELRFELRSALHRVFEHQEPVLSLPIPVRFNGAPHRVLIHVKPIAEDQQEHSQSALVLFVEGEVIEQAAPAMSMAADEAASDIVRRLTDELQLTQARLRTTGDESEAANEELRAANEELQSINEEYRSTSEELETSKEELQSINEELQTVNSELKLKLEAVSRAHSDLQNLMAATDFGTLFLDTSLRIKRFTQPVTELFSITPNDEGRPLTDFAHRLDYDDLMKDAQAILSDLTPIKREIRSRTNHWYDVRMRPYRTIEDKIDGVVITFVDITERRSVEEALRESERMLWQEKHLVDLARDPIFMWDFDGGILEWNRGSEELYGYTRQEAVGQTKEALLKTTVPGSSFSELKTTLAEQGSWSGELRQKSKAGHDLTVETRILLETMDGRRLALESTRDITERKTWEQRQKLLLGELTHRVKNTLAVVQSITRQTLRSSATGEEFAERLEGRLTALASAHSLLVESEWQGADLGALAHNQLEPYISEKSDRLHIEGDIISLPPDLATPFGLVLHELATNAAKFGSLSKPGGKVSLTWTVRRNGERTLKVVWREMKGPPVAPPTHSGFGGALIERGIRGATVTREFNADGLVCTIELPLADARHDASYN